MFRPLIHSLLTIALASSALPALDLRPIAGPDAVLSRQRFGELREMWRHLTVEDYQKNGQHDPAWDADLTQLLESLAVLESGAPDVPGALTQNEALTLARKLNMPDACRDPLAPWALFMLLRWDVNVREDAWRAAEAALEGFSADAERHPDRTAHLLRAKCLIWLVSQYGKNSTPELHKFATSFAKRLATELAASIHVGECNAFPALWLTSIADISFPDEECSETVVKAIDAAVDLDKPGPWLANGLRGVVRIRSAWGWRGGGWANTVTNAGQAGYERNLIEADALVMASSKADPTDPVMPALGCVIAGAGFSKTSMDTWILRSLTACFDHNRAFTYARQFLLPRWGVDYEQLIDLGCDCVDTARFDTTTPWQLWSMVQTCYRDAKEQKLQADFFPAIRRPRVRAAVDALQRGVKADPHTKQWEKANGLAILFALQGRLPEARNALDEVPVDYVDVPLGASFDVDMRALKGTAQLRHEVP